MLRVPIGPRPSITSHLIPELFIWNRSPSFYSSLSMNDDYFTWNQCLYWSCEQWTCNCNAMNPISDKIKLPIPQNPPFTSPHYLALPSIYNQRLMCSLSQRIHLSVELTYSVLEYIWVSPYAISNWILNFIFLSFRIKLSKRIEIYTQSNFFIWFTCSDIILYRLSSG